MHRLKERRPSGDLPGMAAWAGEQHGQGQADAVGVEPDLLRPQQRLQLGKAAFLLGIRNLAGRGGGGRSGARGIFEGEGLGEGYSDCYWGAGGERYRVCG